MAKLREKEMRGTLPGWFVLTFLCATHIVGGVIHKSVFSFVPPAVSGMLGVAKTCEGSGQLAQIKRVWVSVRKRCCEPFDGVLTDAAKAFKLLVLDTFLPVQDPLSANAVKRAILEVDCPGDWRLTHPNSNLERLAEVCITYHMPTYAKVFQAQELEWKRGAT